MLNTEEWKDIPDLPYEISSLGIVRRKDGLYKHANKTHVQPYLNNKGYWCVHCYKNSRVHKFQIHRLLATLFITNPENKSYINHIDGNTQNNELTNLEWCTQSENIQHAWDTGLMKKRHRCASVVRKGSKSAYIGVSWSATRNKWVASVGFKGKTYSGGRHTDEIEAAKAYDALVIKHDLMRHGYKRNFS